MNRVLVIGLDGATWDILKPMAESDALPTIRWLMKEGSWGTLRSTYPPSTVPAWVSFQTGKEVPNHGCFYFTQPKNSLEEFRIVNSNDITGETFHELLSQNGKKSVLINLPLSYPPRSGEITITCFLTPGDNYVFPPELIEEIPELNKYRLLPNASLRDAGKREEYAGDVRDVERIRFDCARTLFKEKEWRFFFVLFSGTDWIQHEEFEDIVNRNLGDSSEVTKLYRDIDSYIKWFLENTPRDTTVIIMSDHGFKQYERSFCINTWLAQKSYLRYSAGQRVFVGLHQEGERLLRKDEEMKKDRAKDDSRLLENLSPFLKRVTLLASKYPAFLSFIEKVHSKVKGIVPVDYSSNLKFNPSESIALGVKWGGIYINDRQRFSDGKVADFEHVVERMFGELEEIEDPRTRRRVFTELHLTRGSGAANLPDIICESEEYWLSDSYASSKLFRDEKLNWHSRSGILLVYGPSIKQGYDVLDVKIWDIAPTILHIFGIPVPLDMDGQVLKDIFRDSPGTCEENRSKLQESYGTKLGALD